MRHLHFGHAEGGVHRFPLLLRGDSISFTIGLGGAQNFSQSYPLTQAPQYQYTLVYLRLQSRWSPIVVQPDL